MRMVVMKNDYKLNKNEKKMLYDERGALKNMYADRKSLKLTKEQICHLKGQIIEIEYVISRLIKNKTITEAILNT